MPVTFDVVSIGCLSHNRFWNEPAPVRAPHATTTLIRDEEQTILVDPSLPVELLVHRLGERTGLTPDGVDRVFLTSFQPIHRRGLSAFDRAEWLMYEDEIEAYRGHLMQVLDAEREGEPEEIEVVRQELAVLERIQPAPERLTAQVHLFPSPGVTPGSCSLLLATPTTTIAVAGDAAINRDYLEHGRAYERCNDAEQATASLGELVEIADQIICGHDNVVVCQARGL